MALHVIVGKGPVGTTTANAADNFRSLGGVAAL